MARFKFALVTVLFAVVAACSSNSPTASNGGSSGASGSTNATGGTGAAGGFGGAAGASGGVGGLSGGTCDAGAPLTVTSNHTPDTTVGASYSYSYQATGGCPPYTWTVTSGSLPPGLSLSQDGTISGSATTIGTYSFTVQCCDSAGSCVSNDRGIVVTAGSGSGGSGAGGSAGSGATGGSGGSGAAQGLLPGCTVVTSGVAGSSTSATQPAISCAIPAGWTLAAAEGFEGGALVDSSAEELSDLAITCSSTTPPAHTGSCYTHFQLTHSDVTPRWILHPHVIGTSHEVYVSWWEYDTATMSENGNNGLFSAKDPSASQATTSFDHWPENTNPFNCLDGVGPQNQYNCHNSFLVIEAFSTTSTTAAHYGPLYDDADGQWNQWEIHYQANTPGNSDGQAQLYRNGQRMFSFEGVNFTGTTSMNGMSLQVGGNYTALEFTDSTGTTCEVPGSVGSVLHTNMCEPFSNCSPCPNIPDFSRDFDDIIVLKK